MGRETLKIFLSLLGAGAAAFCAFVLLEAAFSMHHGPGAVPRGALLFRFQLSAMLAMGLFAGLAIVFYARLSRAMPSQKKPWQRGKHL